MEQVKVKAAEQEMKLKEEMYAAAQQKLEAQQKSHQEHTEQLIQKMEQERSRQKEESERVISEKLRVSLSLGGGRCSLQQQWLLVPHSGSVQ